MREGMTRSTTFPWLMRDSEHMRADLGDCSPAEGDRRLIIVQEITAGRLMLAEDVRPLWEAAWAWPAGTERHTGAAVLLRAREAFPAPEEWRA